MASVPVELTELKNLSNSFPLVGEYYELKLKQSVQDLLAEIRREGVGDMICDLTNFSVYVDIFYQLLQAKVDAPFEAIWVYAALNFRSRDSAESDALDRISVAKDLFQILSACSASSGASKCIALLVPVIFEVHRVILKLFAGDLSAKRDNKAMREAKSLLDNILGYISVCCSKNSDEEHGSLYPNLIFSFTDLVNVWTSTNGEWESFLPLVSSDVCRWISTRGLDVATLAAAVIIQAFLLKMCFSLHLVKPTDELEKNLKSWAVSTISSFQNACFFEILMRTILGTRLPLSSILKPEDDVILRKVLFDAVLLVEYPFLHHNAKLMQSLTLTRLIAAHVAVEHCRGIGVGDESRALSYGKAFSASHAPLEIVKCVKNQHNLEDKASRINGSSHRAILKWLLSLEDKGIEVFEDDFLRSHAKLGLDVSQAGHLEANMEAKVADDDLFYVDKTRGEENTSEADEQNKLASAAFVAAAKTMKATDSGKRKRNGTSSARKIKSVKYELLPDPDPKPAVNAGTSVSKDSSGGESEVEDPADSDSQDTD